MSGYRQHVQSYGSSGAGRAHRNREESNTLLTEQWHTPNSLLTEQWHTPKGAGRRRGLILPVILMMLVLVGLLAASFAFHINARVTSTQILVNRLQTRLAAESGIEKIKLLLKQDRLNMDRWYNNPEELHRAIVWMPGGEESVWDTTDEFEESETPKVYRYTLAADDFNDDETLIRAGITDEASKLNLNTATAEQLLSLVSAAVGDREDIVPTEIVQAILDWRDEDTNPSGDGGDTEGEYYNNLIRPYKVKNGPLDTVEELLLVKGVDGRILYGEDYDRNGLLSPNEDDGDERFPPDNGDGLLNRGLYPYVTVHSDDLNVSNDNRDRIYLYGDQTQVRKQLMEEFEEPGKVNYILQRVQETAGNGGGGGESGGGTSDGGAAGDGSGATTNGGGTQTPGRGGGRGAGRGQTQPPNDTGADEDAEEDEEDGGGSAEMSSAGGDKSSRFAQTRRGGDTSGSGSGASGSSGSGSGGGRSGRKPGSGGPPPPAGDGKGGATRPPGSPPGSGGAAGDGGDTSSGGAASETGDDDGAPPGGTTTGDDGKTQSGDNVTGGAADAGDDGQGGADGTEGAADSTGGGSGGGPGGESGQDNRMKSPADLLVREDGGGGGGPFDAADLPILMDRLTTQMPRTELPGLINVNTAPAAVLRCISDISEDEVAAIMAQRAGLDWESKSTTAWLVTSEVLTPARFAEIAPYITARGTQFTIESLGYADHLGMITRLQVIVEMRGPLVQTIYQRDLTHLGGRYPIREGELEKTRAE